MGHTNAEIKARCRDPRTTGKALRAVGADYHGTDRQIDTYFRVDQGRLKLRQGEIETALIHYHRPDAVAARWSDALVYYPVDSYSGMMLSVGDQVSDPRRR